MKITKKILIGILLIILSLGFVNLFFLSFRHYFEIDLGLLILDTRYFIPVLSIIFAVLFMLFALRVFKTNKNT